MLELRLAGVHEDGEHLVLESADGTSYLLPIDQNLRTSIAKARRIQPIRGRGGSGVFGPRDIQARFRQGATVEEIVNESGWEAERVRKYEWPIIAERQHIISAARNARISDVSSRGSAAQNSTLDQRLKRVLTTWNLDEADSYWSTYQQDSGQWTISFEIPLSDEQRASLPVDLLLPARWTYNPANQSIYASNDAAYFFMGNNTETQETPVVVTTDSKPAVTDSAPVRETEKHVDFARHADENTQFPRVESLKAVRVPQDDVQEEILEELDSRRGTRDFGSASERKLADLLERARRSHAATQENQETKAEQTTVSEQTPSQIVPAHQAAEEDLAEAEVVEEATDSPELETFSSRAERRNHMMQKYLASQNSSEKTAVENTTEISADTEENLQEKDADEVQQVRSERDAAGSSWRSQNSAKPVTEEDANTSEAAEDLTDESGEADEAPETDSQDSKPTRSSKPKRASVPSWDDIIFGSQRK